MPSGAHARSGPPPDPNSIRSQNRGITVVTLPSAGFQGTPPEWPMNGQLEREAAVWAEVWRSPQATQWIDQPWRWLVIGMYVRTFVRCEMPGAKAAEVNALRLLADEVGMTVTGLKVNAWKIGPKMEAITEPAPAAANVLNFRDRANRVANDGA